MVREMSSKLRNYGIPFFGTKSDLVIPSGKEEVTPGDGGRKLEIGMIHEAECKSSYSSLIPVHLGLIVYL